MNTTVSEIEQASKDFKSLSDYEHDLVVIDGKPLNDMEIRHVYRDGEMLICLDFVGAFNTDIFDGSGLEALANAYFPGLFPVFVYRHHIKDEVLNTPETNHTEE